ncbi:Phytotoxin, PcF [Phytophthora cactorum]|nr:Phytotoxin, PcF [Phytophthora cactorum]
MFATTINAQRYCSAQGCGSIYSDRKLVINDCCSSQSSDFHQCCRTSCNLGTPCK